MRVDPHELEAAFIAWNKTYTQDDESLAIDGKVMCNAVLDFSHLWPSKKLGNFSIFIKFNFIREIPQRFV